MLRASYITPSANLKINNTQLSQTAVHSDTFEELFMFGWELLPKVIFVLA
jgi:hypothetical protein